MQPMIWLNWRSKRVSSGIGLCLGLLILGTAEATCALPGQTVDEAAAWIQAHPTLQPTQGERLQVRKSDTPAHRFTFAALPFAPGQVDRENSNRIRMEQMSFFDRTTGVSQLRLEDALQVIYGPDVYQDYQQASIVYHYPDPTNPDSTQERSTPLQESLQGEVRQGDRYAYWVETAPTGNGIAYNGQISIFLIEDVEKLVSALQRR